MAASIKDVAKEANVSIATVSRVLNDVDVVNEDTKKKVVEAINKLGYRPNIVARSLKTQRTKTIGIIIPDISSQFYPEIVRGAEDGANIYDYNVMLCNTDLDKQKEIEYLRVLREKMVDGVIFMSNSLDKEVIDVIKNLQMPTVLVETRDKEGEFPSVTIDNKLAAREAVNYLIGKGKKKIAYMGTQENAMNAAADRYVGYKEAIEEHGLVLNMDRVFFGGLKAQDGYNGMEEVLKRTKDIDAVFCASDECAMGAINSLRENGFDIPQDVEVIGFDNIYAASIFYPKVSTVAQPMYDMGSVGMRMLIKMINKKELEERNIVLSHELIKRQTCK